MGRKRKVIVFICSAIKDGKLISSEIEADNINKACDIFQQENNIKPETVLGSFIKKKQNISYNKNKDIKFKFGENKQGIYKGWKITAMPLLNPPNFMYVFFNNKIDGKKERKPKPIILEINKIEEIK